jgi:hypothetical protein
MNNKSIPALFLSALLVGCATSKDPIWSEYYQPAEYLLKAPPTVTATSIQGKTTFLQTEAEFKEHLETMNYDMKNLVIGGIYVPSQAPLTHEKLQNIASEFGGDRYEYIAFPLSPTATYNHIWIKLSPERQKTLHKQRIIKFTLPPTQ